MKIALYIKRDHTTEVKPKNSSSSLKSTFATHRLLILPNTVHTVFLNFAFRV